MDASTARELLPEYLLGTLDRPEADAVEAALAADPELRHEADALANALFVVPEALEPEPLPDDAWSRLQAALRGGAAAGARDHARAPIDGREREQASDATSTTSEALEADVASGTRAASGGVAIREPRSRPLRTWGLALAASLALLVAVGAWGVQETRENARTADQQRVIAYWMRNPNLRIVSLEGVGAGAPVPGEDAAAVPPGIVCVLPDGRAMMLQPYDAPHGSRYVLYGVGPEGRVRLGETTDRFLLFGADELAEVHVELEGAREGVVARADL